MHRLWVFSHWLGWFVVDTAMAIDGTSGLQGRVCLQLQLPSFSPKQVFTSFAHLCTLPVVLFSMRRPADRNRPRVLLPSQHVGNC
jgi:hypothetical protein